MKGLKDCELLLPAGSMEALDAALRFGADAVYVGGPFMQLRSARSEFSLEQLRQATQKVHSLGKKIYVAVNVFATNSEIDALDEYARQLYDTGVDAAIISDLGTLSAVKKAAPNLEIHISTQANIQNYETANMFYSLGAKRVVLGREMRLDEIAELRARTPSELQIETFVHGAMCMSYSGRCLISSFLNGRSGNRGECTQPCRWQYALEEQKRPGEYFPVIEEDGKSAILSSHDLNCIAILPQIADAGVTSFKIEGRMKTAYYVATVANAYRRRMDDTADLEQLNYELECVSHRPYSTGFYFGDLVKYHRNDGEYHSLRQFTAVVTQSLGNNNYMVQMRNRFALGDTLEILSPDSIGESFILEKMTSSDGENIEICDKVEELVIIKTDKHLSAGDILRK